MHNRMTSRRRRPASPGSDGRTVPAQGQTTMPKQVARLPHEHDESSDSQTHAEPSGQRMGKQAHKDVRAGMQDTSKAPEMDRAYRQVKDGR